MYNKDLVEKMIEKFGLEATTQWCRMEAYKYKLFSEKEEHVFTKSEIEYESEWWQSKYEELIKNNK